MRNAAQHLNDIRAITDAAARLGVDLPDEIAAQADHLTQLVAEERTTTPRTAAQYANALAAHLGNPAALDSSR